MSAGRLLLLLVLDVTSIDFFDFFDARAPLLLDEDEDEDEHDDEVDLASALLLFLDFLADEDDEDDRKEPFPLVLLFPFITLLLFPFVKLDGVDEAVMVVSNSSSLTDDEHDELFDSVATFCLLILLLFTVLETYSL